ncbi:hypothetical protein M9H77_26922 [Catharanthus roseus]|uniref:Uncharacterized protein n=1 Tax=Catharanthus roseus TaxID=4058 RepID=A0ACC0ABX9_CATRO|nr:hypothetical protein M9H77_26922 [Catharanthus roseus]
MGTSQFTRRKDYMLSCVYLFILKTMPPRNSTVSNKRSRAIAGPSNNEPILPLPYRISDEANRMWYNAKLRNRLVVERTIHALLESQMGILEHFAMGWNSFVTMTGEYYPNRVREFYPNIFFKSNPYKTDITTTVKSVWIHLDQAILSQILVILDERHLIFYERASTSIFADPTWAYSKALARFSVHAHAVGKKVVKSNGLEGTWKVTSLLISTNITPQSPNQTND